MTAPRYLLPDEVPRVDVRRHWAVLLLPGGKAAAIFAVLVVLWLLTGSATVAGVLNIAMLAVLGWFGWQVAQWRHERFVVTDKRVLLITGLLTQRIGMMPLLKVTDMTYERSWLGRRLSYGAFVMESAGQDQALHRVDYVPHPEEVSQTMFELLFGGPARGARSVRDGPRPAEDYPTDPNLPVIAVPPEELPEPAGRAGDVDPRRRP